MTREERLWKLGGAGASADEAGLCAKRIQGYASGFGGAADGFDYVEVQDGATERLCYTKNFTREGAEEAVDWAKKASVAFVNAGN